ncbi:MULTISPECIES: hypothetical protein [unclassified Sphingomonas]|uniref:hypothetical protein n=1 Tax=Sphingomonas TaxID=13687 RepID=UPI001AC92984|nr:MULTISPECIES: hypothetical protein [unclassified Sphingomonas]MBN8812588.1 hypothetical protein [Sphingomonas sp.]
MPSVRIAALVALGLAVLLWVLWLVPREADYADRLTCLAALFVAAANSAMVAHLGRIRRAELSGSALWLVMIGVGIAIALGSFEDWAGLVLPSDGSLTGALAAIAVARWIAVALFLAGLSALAAGWVLWFASRLAGRARAA